MIDRHTATKFDQTPVPQATIDDLLEVEVVDHFADADRVGSVGLCCVGPDRGGSVYGMAAMLGR
jgi:hypothetical protein